MPLTPYYSHSGITIYHADCREVLPQLESESFGLVFTDPPYHRDKNWLYGTIALKARRLLRPYGFCFAYCGADSLPSVVSLMAPHLDWFWLFSIQHRGAHPRVWNKRLMVAEKPVLAWTRGLPPQDQLAWMATKWESDKADKLFHRWGQGAGFAHETVAKRSTIADRVLDPCLGGGTTARVCKDLGRAFVGIEIDEQSCEIAARRLSQEVFDFSGASL